MHPRSEESSDLRKANEKLQVGFGMIWWAKTEKKNSREDLTWDLSNRGNEWNLMETIGKLMESKQPKWITMNKLESIPFNQSQNGNELVIQPTSLGI